jgi:hypothetical protein
MDGVVGIATGYGLDGRGFEVSSPGGFNNFLFSTSSRPALGPPNLLSSGYQGLFPGGKAAGA